MAGEISHFRTVKLEECAAFQEGYVNPSQGVAEYFGNEVKWLRAVDLNDAFVWETSRRLSRKGYESAGKAALLFEPDTLAISKSGTIGRLGILKDYMCGNRAVINIKPDQAKCDTRFIFYSLLIRRPEIETRAVGSVQPNLYCSALGDIEITLPPLAEQKAIAAVLGALDDKIELNRRMNATLEAMARALFQSWFVDFDPVRAKLDGRPLEPATADLFPASFQDSPLGLIPQGWEVKTIADVTLRVTKGDTPRSEAIQGCPKDDRLIPMLRVNAITEVGEVLLDKAEMIPESIHLGKSKRSILEENDILYTNAGTIGRVALVQKHFLPANTNQAVAIIRPDPARVPPAFLYMIMRHSEFQTKLHHDVVQAVQANLALGKISAARAVFPPMATLTRLTVPLVALLDKIFENRNKSRTLATLRDTLLPKLLSGELSVANVPKEVEAT